jgi:hypothetical protein
MNNNESACLTGAEAIERQMMQVTPMKPWHHG